LNHPTNQEEDGEINKYSPISEVWLFKYDEDRKDKHQTLNSPVDYVGRKDATMVENDQ